VQLRFVKSHKNYTKRLLKIGWFPLNISAMSEVALALPNIVYDYDVVEENIDLSSSSSSTSSSSFYCDKA